MGRVIEYIAKDGRENLLMPALEKIRERIRDRLAATGLSANEASRRAGLGLSYVNDLLSGKSKNPVTTRLAQLATVLECDLGYLQGTQDVLIAGEVVPFPSANAGKPEGEAMGTRGMPLYSVNLSDPDGFFGMNDDDAAPFSPLGTVESDANAYCVSVTDEANAPRYMPGEVVIVSTRKPVSTGSFAVIRLEDGRGLIRQVVSITPTEIDLKALGDGSTHKIARSEVRSIHKIIGSVEG